MILLVALVLAFFVVPEGWRLPVVVIGLVVEVLETAAEVWWSRRGRIKMGPETVIGAVGIVVRDCRPDGQVRVQGEIWLARCDAGASIGERVTVVGRDGLTLIVELVM